MRLSQIIPSRNLAIITVSMSFFYILVSSESYPFAALIPFILMIINGLHVSVISGLFLSFIWIAFISMLLSPFIYFIGYSKFIFMIVYVPIGIVFCKKPSIKSAPVFLFIQTLFWDLPLLFWIHIISLTNGRALEPFYSEINDDLSVGSLPLYRDAPFLSSKGIGLVINMCREYKGPLTAYNNFGITQLHIPTPDICEPEYMDIIKGLLFVHDYKSKDINKQKKIFVHCKAGRGRAATFALCYLISLKKEPNEAIQLLKSKRKVVEAKIINSVVVKKFIQDCLRFSHDLEVIAKHNQITIRN